jgi:hypothetical protein
MANTEVVGGLQYDAQGRPYYVLANGRRSYVSPVAMGGKPEDSGLGTGGNFFRGNGEWNQDTGEVEHHLAGGNLLSAGIGGMLAAPLLGAAFGGGGAASLPTGGMTSGLIGEGAAAGAAAGGGGMLGSLPAWLKPAIGIGGPLLSRAFSGGGGPENPSDEWSGGDAGGGSAQLNALIQLLLERAQRTAPVHQAATDMALKMAPSMQSTPRMSQAIESAKSPRPQMQQDPQVLAAIHKLMSGGA